MARISTSRTERTLTHIYVRDSQKGFVRPCWSSREAIYCGTCLKGTVQPVVGEVCPNLLQHRRTHPGSCSGE